MKNRNGRSGFSLVEVSIAMAVMAVIGGTFMSLLLTTRIYGKSTVNQMIAKREGYVVIETLSRRLREARLVTISSDSRSIEILNTDGTTSRVYFDAGADGSSTGIEDNHIVFVDDVDEGSQKIIARRPSLVSEAPLFSRIQNHIWIRLRLGDALDNPTIDRLTGIGHEGYEVNFKVFLRNA